MFSSNFGHQKTASGAVKYSMHMLLRLLSACRQFGVHGLVDRVLVALCNRGTKGHFLSVISRTVELPAASGRRLAGLQFRVVLDGALDQLVQRAGKVLVVRVESVCVLHEAA